LEFDMIDNFDNIRSILTFPESQDDRYFYFLQIMQRRKDNPELSGNNRIIKSYYVHSLDYFDKIKSEVITLCETFNARAGIRLNLRDARQVGFAAMQQMVTSLQQPDYRHFQRVYEKAAGQHCMKDGRTWILDIDEGTHWHENYWKLPFMLGDIEPAGDKLVKVIPSNSGYHLIVKPFNLQQAKDLLKDIEIHKDNPTNLFIP